MGKRQWHPEYNYQETRRYICRAYHNNGRTGCTGWTAFEQTVKKGVVSFLVDLLDNKLHWREHMEETARVLQREHSGDRVQALQAEMDQANHEIIKVQEGFVNGIFTTQEAKTRTMEARERIERLERRLGELEAAGEVRAELSAALRFLEKPLPDFLNELPPEALARLCRAVFQHFSIHTSGVARLRKAEIVAYELTPVVKQALVDNVHNEPLTPALEIV